jgi:hypothetical protein
MKALLILILFLFTSCLSAPRTNEIYILRAEPVKTFDSILYAFIMTESTNRADAVNSKGYTGILQLGKIMVDEANRICKLTGNPARFNYEDRLDSLKSIQIWYVVQDYRNPTYDLQKAIKIWNPGSGTQYADTIKKYIKEIL